MTRPEDTTAPTPTPRQTHRVAIVIFAECEGIDARDAANGAILSLNHALAGERLGTYKTLPSPPRPDGRTWDTTVHDVMEVGAAAANGYLWTTPTAKAYPRD